MYCCAINPLQCTESKCEPTPTVHVQNLTFLNYTLNKQPKSCLAPFWGVIILHKSQHAQWNSALQEKTV